jgi:hypothetical protein
MSTIQDRIAAYRAREDEIERAEIREVLIEVLRERYGSGPQGT